MFLPLIYDMASNLNISGDLGSCCLVQHGRERFPLSCQHRPHLTHRDPAPRVRTQPLLGKMPPHLLLQPLGETCSAGLAQNPVPATCQASWPKEPFHCQPAGQGEAELPLPPSTPLEQSPGQPVLGEPFSPLNAPGSKGRGGPLSWRLVSPTSFMLQLQSQRAGHASRWQSPPPAGFQSFPCRVGGCSGKAALLPALICRGAALLNEEPPPNPHGAAAPR